MMTTFTKIIDKFRREAWSERDKGFRFERLMQAYLKTTSLYAGRFEEVWLWSEFPCHDQFGGKDIGIDLVAKTFSGEYWAVQCKCYADDKYITKPDVDTFLSTSGKTFEVEGVEHAFAQRLWISTTNKWNSVAELTIKKQTPQVTRLNLIDLEADDVDWEKLEHGLYGKASRPKPFAIMEHQQKAINRVHEYFKTRDRGKLIMACGTGKTFTSLKIAENETQSNGFVLFLVPSIALLGQTLRAWSAQADVPIHAVCICSDGQVSQQKIKNDEEGVSVIDLALPASTNTDYILYQLEALRHEGRKGMTVVFSTYQSIEVISRAQQELLKRTKGEYGIFDLIICDEAHRTTGISLKGTEESAFIKVHDNDFIQAKRRLYMTATPRLYTDEARKKAEESDVVMCSMDDVSLYGDEIYRIGFGEAVEKQLLTDYKVLILAVGDKDITPALRDVITNEDGTITVDDASKFVGCINALSKRVLGDEGLIKAADPLPMRRAVAFCSTIKASKATARVFTDCKSAYMEDVSAEDKALMVDVVAEHVDGTMSATERDQKLMWLKGQTENDMECRMLTNARCLSEGVDVPSLDAVVFVSPKNSQVDVVQSVGRVMRRSPGKKYGYIIIPVVIPENVEGDEVLSKHPNFKVVWTVLNALRAHDDRFNAEVNKIELSKQKPKHILFGGVGSTHDDDSVDSSLADATRQDTTSAAMQMAQQLSLQFEDLQNVFYAKMVTKVGSKRYWELWAKDIAKIAEEHIERIKTLIADEGKHKKAFEQLMRGLRKNINPNLTEQEVIEMLSQHLIAMPVFEALFGNYEFAVSNPVSKAMQKMLALLDDEAKTEEENERLQKFYDYVRTTVGDITDAEGRQRLIVELYDKFFKVASPKTVEKLGIVYTPVEVVDFIIHSVGYIIQKEFGRSLSDENVHILDPFTGTGTFITRLLQSGLISRDALERKYLKEIHANEIVLMAYYIASINIENVYHSLMPDKEYKSFDGICLTDTFQLGEQGTDENLFSEQFPTNSKRVIAQKKCPITVIIGNPPYSIGQKSANDNAQNQSYPILEKQIESTYVAESKATLNRSAYDSYIKAIRWSTDRLGTDNDGIISFVTNNAWLTANGLDGMRKCLEKDFSSIFVFDLKGGIRGKKGEQVKREGQNIFNIITGISIVFLIKRKTKSKCRIFYSSVDNGLTKKEKLDILNNVQDISSSRIAWRIIEPNQYGDWLDFRNDLFNSYIPLRDDCKNGKSFFVISPPAVVTGRDFWVYNFSKIHLEKNMSRMIDFYNNQCVAYSKLPNCKISVEDFIETDMTKISWTRSLRNAVKKKKTFVYSPTNIRISTYRPFQKEFLYFSQDFNEAYGKNINLFPYTSVNNKVICVSGIGGNDIAVQITNEITDFAFVKTGNGGTQCFPLYWYEENNAKITDLFYQENSETTNKYIRKDGISDWILNIIHKQYGYKVTKEDIFYYVYGLLHSSEYRTMFATDLKKSLPRLPLVEKVDDFWGFSKAGHELANLHLNYETVEPYRKCQVIYAPLTNKGESINYHVEKMRFGKIDSKTVDKSIIYYNKAITIEDIPAEAYGYVVNGKSAIEWIMERYAITTDKKSGIINDPNDWAREHNDEKYIFNLLLRIINVSVQTVKIVKGLPKLKF